VQAIPLFFYVVHVFVIHAFAAAMTWFVFGSAGWLFGHPHFRVTKAMGVKRVCIPNRSSKAASANASRRSVGAAMDKNCGRMRGAHQQCLTAFN